MINRNRSHKVIAICLTVSLLTAYSMISLGMPAEVTTGFSGELFARGGVFVNDTNAIDGTTIFSDSVLATTPDSNAIVSLGKLGRVELLPGSSMKLSFNEMGITGLLNEGSVRVFVPEGVSAVIMTKDGSVVAGKDQEAAYTVSVEKDNTFATALTGQAELRTGNKVTPIASGESASTGPRTRVQGGSGLNLSGGQKVALITGIGVAVALIVYFIVRDDDDEMTPVISPTK